jgi:hypothetical protein
VWCDAVECGFRFVESVGCLLEGSKLIRVYGATATGVRQALVHRIRQAVKTRRQSFMEHPIFV